MSAALFPSSLQASFVAMKFPPLPPPKLYRRRERVFFALLSNELLKADEQGFLPRMPLVVLPDHPQVLSFFRPILPNIPLPRIRSCRPSPLFPLFFFYGEAAVFSLLAEGNNLARYPPLSPSRRLEQSPPFFFLQLRVNSGQPLSLLTN